MCFLYWEDLFLPQSYKKRGFRMSDIKAWQFLIFKSFILIHMIYYKFLNDKKGDLSQLWIAAQSPNKVSKRVILDISITVGYSKFDNLIYRSVVKQLVEKNLHFLYE